MKYMLLINAASADAGDQCSVEEWMVYDKQIQETGIVVASESLADLTTATTVRVGPDGARVGPDGARAVTTDGPFAETREVLGGFYVVDVPDLDVALDWAARCPGARGGGSVVVRPIADFGQ
ncbi:YciI family protein [Rhodococcus sp. 2H158]